MEIVERFISLEGEGIFVGYPTVFIRLARCNLKCSFCDTTYAFDGSRKIENITTSELYNWILETGVRRVSFTGGEPFLQQKELVSLVFDLIYAGNLVVNIETNGSIKPIEDWKSVGFYFFLSVSPKLNFLTKNYLEALYQLRTIFLIQLKMVITEENLDDTFAFIKEYAFHNNIFGVVLQPCFLKEVNYSKYSRILFKKSLSKLEELNKKDNKFRFIPQVNKFLKLR